VVAVEHDGRRTCSGGAENAQTHRARLYTSLDISDPGAYNYFSLHRRL
jgi:hypothetical protein